MAIKLYYHKTTFQLITIDDGGESLIVGDDGSKVFEFYFGTGTALVDFVLDTTIPLTYEGRVIFERADGDKTNEVYLTPIAGGFYRYVIGDWATAVDGDLKITTRLKLGAVVTNFGIATIPVEDGVAPDDGSTISQAQYDAVMGAVNEVIIGVTPIAYDNSTSGLAAVDVQGAIDEVDADVDALTVRVTTAESDIDAVEGRATVLETFQNTTVPATYETISNVDLVRNRVEDLETFKNTTVPTTYETKADATSKLALKVDKTTEIANVAIGEGISLETLKTAIGLATTSLSGLMSATDKGYLNELYALLDTDDIDSFVDTLGEVLLMFSNYPEGTDLVTQFATKVDKVLSSYDTLTGESVVGTELVYIDAGGTTKKMTLNELFEASNSSAGAFVPNGVYENLTVGYAQKSALGVEIDTKFGTIDGEIDDIIDGTQDIDFSNTISGLTATTIKGALDEIDGNVDELETFREVTVPATYETKEDATTHKARTTALENANMVKSIAVVGTNLFTITFYDNTTSNILTLAQLKTFIGEATNALSGLMSAQHVTDLEILMALFDADGDAVVNTIAEVLAIFENYPEGVDLVTALAGKVDKNNAITAGTKTKITYDEKGLVTGGADLTESDIPPLAPSKITQDANNRFVNDTEKSTWNGKQNALTNVTTAEIVTGTATTQKTVTAKAVHDAIMQIMFDSLGGES